MRPLEMSNLNEKIHPKILVHFYVYFDLILTVYFEQKKYS